MPMPIPPKLSAKGAAALDELLKTSVEGRTVPATYFGATTADGPLYFNCAGERVFGEPDKGEVTEGTMLQLFSSTKLVTSVAVLQLLDKGVIDDLDNPALIEKYCPDLWKMEVIEGFTDDGKPITHKRRNPLTLKRLLSHSSGLSYPFTSPLLVQWEKETNAPGIWSGTTEGFLQPLVYEPGTKWLYSVGIDWAGIFVERITGQSLEEYFREHIFTPCGITTITFYPTDEIKARMQQMVGRDVDHVGKLVHKPSIRPLDGEVGQLSGGGGLFGTSRDYLRFLQGVLASTKGDGKGLLSQQSYDLLFANALPPRGPNNTCYADLARMAKGQTYHDPSQVEAEELEHSIGLCLNPKDSVHGRKGGSGCWDGAAKTQYWLDPKTGIAAVCATQILAPNPDPFMELYNKYERTLYDGLD